MRPTFRAFSKFIAISLVAFGAMVSPLFAAGSDKIDPALQAKIARSSKGTGYHSIIIEVAGLQGLKSADLGEDSTEILEKIRVLTSESQAPLLETLKGMERLGLVKKIEPLYIANYIIALAKPEAIERLADEDTVTFLHDDRTIQLPVEPTNNRVNKDEVPTTYGLQKINAIQAWKEYGLSGAGVVAGNLDTGVDSAHPDLKGKVILFKNFTSDTGSNEGFDGHGHGTHTIGTMVGGTASGKAIGVAPDAKIISGKIFTGSGSTQESWILKAMEWIADPDGNPATKDAPRLVSNSWGGGAGSLESEKPMWDIVQRWVDLNIVPVFAAGNSGPSAKTVGTPGGYPHSWAVGATDSSDGIAYFSSRGPITWGDKSYIKPDISAPGVDVYSAKPGGGWQNMSGTSMATPHTAGALCLLLQAAPGLTVAQVREICESTALDLGNPGWDNSFGQGRLDIHKAVTKALFGGKIAGAVKASDGAGIPNARISIVGSDLQFSADQQGAFEGFLKEGEYQGKAEAFGFIASTKGFKVVKKQTTAVDFKLDPAPAGQLSGSIVNAEGQGIQATLKLLNTPLPEQMVQGSNFTLKGPVGSYKLSVLALGYKAAEVSVTIPGTVKLILDKLPPILLVDDDKDQDYEKYFVEALQNHGADFTLHSVNGDGPSLSTMSQYPLVIWFTGRDYQSTITDGDQGNLKKYLAAGGHLFITGQDIGYQIGTTDLYKNNFGALFKSDNSNSSVITGAISANISGSGGADNQKYPDVIQAQAGAQLLVSYGSGMGAGVRKGNVIYLGFGFEGLNTEESRKEMMGLVLKALLPENGQLLYFVSLVNAVEKAKSQPALFESLQLAEEGLRLAIKHRMAHEPAFAEEVRALAIQHPALKTLR